jgi:hypothetical protein
MVLDEKMNQTVFLVKNIINEIHIQLYPTASSKSPTTVLPIKIITRWGNLDTLVLDSCQKIDVKEFENLKFCNQLSNLNVGFTN